MASTYKPQSFDTTEDAERLQFEIWRRMNSAEKLAIVMDLNETVREAALAGIRQRHPDAGEREIFLRYAAMTLGEKLAVEAYGPELEALLARPDR